jgi:hypothetical protein
MSDTPRTDFSEQFISHFYGDFARTLERELAAKSAEVERLLDQLADVDEEGGALRDALVAIAQPGITLKAAQHAAREALGWYAK